MDPSSPSTCNRHSATLCIARFLRALYLVCLALLAINLGCNRSEKPQNAEVTKSEKATPTKENAGNTTGENGKRSSSLRALKLLEASRFDEAWDECQRVLLTNGNDVRALYVSAQVLQQRGKFEQAMAMVDRIELSDPEYGIKAHRDVLTWAWNKSLLRTTEERALKILSQYPDDYESLKLYAALLDLEGRRYEASLAMQRLLRLGNRDITTMALAIDTVKPVESDAIVKQKLQEAPQEIRLKSSLAFGALYEKNPQAAETLFREILDAKQGTDALWVGLGLSLAEQEDWHRIPEWFANRPTRNSNELQTTITNANNKNPNSSSETLLGTKRAEELPEYWRLLGLWLQSQGMFTEAAQCFTKSLEIDPMNYLSAAPLAQCYTLLNETELAKQAEALFQTTQLANRNLNYCRDGHRREEWMNQLASTLETHGRRFEAILWREVMEKYHRPNGDQLVALENAKKEALNTTKLGQINTGLSRNSDSFPELDLKKLLETSQVQSPRIPGVNRPKEMGQVATKLRWTDVAKEIGGQIHYRNGDDPNQTGMQTYQSNGAGAGTVDFDRDGWPDLFVLQGGGDPRVPSSNDPSVLLRNIRGQSMQSVADQAKVANRAYGQGVAVGDMDQDGFPDLFVLNFGQNLLLRNQGDGTFELIEIPLMRRDVQKNPVWSVSAAIADLDGDHLPDLVEINYASGIDVITHLCVTKENIPQVCRPTEFPASPDAIYLSDGSGNFVSGNDRWNLAMDDGRGLGVIVGNLDGKHGNDIYIANDMSANNLYLSGPSEANAKRWMLADEAVRRGCAVDIQGKPQASMGVGCADVDRNGTLDLFMTNFIDEYNALYTQSDQGFFQDASRRYRLIDPKKKTLGFGTQLIDLDCDGWQDMLVVNGHVDDYRSKGQPYTMRPQVFLQREGGFAEQTGESLGPFFQTEYLSRSLGIWDFNRDGKLDSYVTHLDHPLSILRNDSTDQGNWIALELVGVQSERDAIGAEIHLQAGDERWVHQRLAGNGFECSNEPLIHLGLGDVSKLDSIEIHWPSGLITRYNNVPTNQRILCVETEPEWVEVNLERRGP